MNLIESYAKRINFSNTVCEQESTEEPKEWTDVDKLFCAEMFNTFNKYITNKWNDSLICCFDPAANRMVHKGSNLNTLSNLKKFILDYLTSVLCPTIISHANSETSINLDKVVQQLNSLEEKLFKHYNIEKEAYIE